MGVEMVRKPSKPGGVACRSRGSLALARLGMTQDAIATRVKRSRAAVGHWIAGRRKPRKAERAALAKLGVPDLWWDEDVEVTPPKEPPPQKAPERPESEWSGPVAVKALRLERMLGELLDGVADDPETTPLEKAKVMSSAASTLTALGRLTGEMQDMSEQRILRLPAWRRIQTELIEALQPWPDAMLAVGNRLRELSGD